MFLFTQGVALHYPSHSAASVLSIKVKVVRALHYANIDGVASMDYHGQFNGLHNLNIEQSFCTIFRYLLDNTKITDSVSAKMRQDEKNLDQRTSE